MRKLSARTYETRAHYNWIGRQETVLGRVTAMAARVAMEWLRFIPHAITGINVAYALRSATISSLSSAVYDWRRGWDSHHCCVLKTKNLRDFRFLTTRQIRSKTAVETRIEHVSRRIG
jgi:hypothetical protein